MIAFTPLGRWLEATMVGHVLVEIPLLLAVGAVLGKRLAPVMVTPLQMLNRGGIAGILLCSMTLAVWMIPRWLDAAISDGGVNLIKIATLVGLAGMPLAWSWPRLHFIARGVVKIELLSMLFRLGWLYLISPQRLCNNYLLDDQIWLGRGFLILGALLGVLWLIPVFFGSPAVAGHGGR